MRKPSHQVYLVAVMELSIMGTPILSFIFNKKEDC